MTGVDSTSGAVKVVLAPGRVLLAGAREVPLPASPGFLQQRLAQRLHRFLHLLVHLVLSREHSPPGDLPLRLNPPRTPSPSPPPPPAIAIAVAGDDGEGAGLRPAREVSQVRRAHEA